MRLPHNLKYQMTSNQVIQSALKFLQTFMHRTTPVYNVAQASMAVDKDFEPQLSMRKMFSFRVSLRVLRVVYGQHKGQFSPQRPAKQIMAVVVESRGLRAASTHNLEAAWLSLRDTYEFQTSTPCSSASNNSATRKSFAMICLHFYHFIISVNCLKFI